ncbi:MAG: NUDIX domain-containing protein [Actinomycetales bacterium]|nr:NUDIX domain-containing protein [Actinomycetales bacterium]
MRTSAGLLPFRRTADGVEVFVGHMGGPFWARKDEGAWSIIKGLYSADEEDPLTAARREFTEETGAEVGDGEVIPLGELRASGKLITVYAVVADPSLAFVGSNTVTMEWPPRSGRTIEFPELDRAKWLTLDEARRLLVKGQRPFLDRLQKALEAH